MLKNVNESALTSEKLHRGPDSISWRLLGSAVDTLNAALFQGTQEWAECEAQRTLSFLGARTLVSNLQSVNQFLDSNVPQLAYKGLILNTDWLVANS